MKKIFYYLLILAIVLAYSQENGVILYNPNEEQEIISKLGCVITIKNMPQNGDFSTLISPYEKLAEHYQETMKTTVSVAVRTYPNKNLQTSNTQIKPLKASFYCNAAKVVPLSPKKELITQASPKLKTSLTLDQILNSTWHFYNSDRFLGEIVFQKGGRVLKYDNPNQRFWSFDGVTLSVLRQDKVLTTKYISAERDYFGKWHLWGIFAPAERQWIHYLVQQ